MTAVAPLSGLKVLDFSQFLAGPYASLRLADLGADVIKVERKGKGDLSRYLYVSDVQIDGESTVFHAINRGKRSLAVDLKSEVDREKIWALVDEADVVIQNFRPGVIERLGFGYDAVRERNPKVVYGSVSGYGGGNEWDALPGQDLLAQARSGVMWLTGAQQHGPVAIGLPVADILAGAALAQGVLALLVRRGTTGEGGHVETSLMEAIVDLQFELLSTFLNDGQRLPSRPSNNAAHAFLAAPYGVYETADGHVAIAMNDLTELFGNLGLEFPSDTLDPFGHRDEIAARIADRIVQDKTDYWIAKLAEADMWAAPVMNWQELIDSGILQKLGMIGATERGGQKIGALLSPIRVDGSRPSAHGPAPYLGETPIGWSRD
ncbi:CaiB/BaiF CoA transferase family protein [Hoeflea prorocentri]|uniref:CaiB/BaiF CoA-transferase family protein n=1 Tax=Hoeflea prorocentri TaxID=1922333 RepID=A0A9X3UMT4_9HYPH|nr:CaiB/BaiF CoA-transferase family protein [Hoeflea prorocentri]MCY6381951.1 CaiB/BaiF CoA-transferase family protein [Hoeflea prorocentri]MDA5399751.1 CaiB/BaiF CoA-transferase family protein [Hoeflea prorocentri]